MSDSLNPLTVSFKKFNISAFKRRVERYHMTSRSKVTVRDKQTGKEDEFYPKRKIAPKNGRKRILSNFQKNEFSSVKIL